MEHQTQQSNDTSQQTEQITEVTNITHSLNTSYSSYLQRNKNHSSNSLNPHYIQTLLDPSIHSVEIQYSSNNPDSLYTYLTHLPLKKGDTVVIETPSGHYRTVTVTQFHKTPEIERLKNIDYKWIVSKIPTNRYKKLKKKNNKTIQKITTKQRLDQRNQDRNTYQHPTDHD